MSIELIIALNHNKHSAVYEGILLLCSGLLWFPVITYMCTAEKHFSFVSHAFPLTSFVSWQEVTEEAETAEGGLIGAASGAVAATAAATAAAEASEEAEEASGEDLAPARWM